MSTTNRKTFTFNQSVVESEANLKDELNLDNSIGGLSNNGIPQYETIAMPDDNNLLERSRANSMAS